MTDYSVYKKLFSLKAVTGPEKLLKSKILKLKKKIQDYRYTIKDLNKQLKWAIERENVWKRVADERYEKFLEANNLNRELNKILKLRDDEIERIESSIFHCGGRQ